MRGRETDRTHDYRVARFFFARDTKNRKNLPNQHQMCQMITHFPKKFQMFIKYIYIFQYKYVRPTKVYPKWDFLFENKSSGNPATHKTRESARYKSFAFARKTLKDSLAIKLRFRTQFYEQNALIT
jgi:hypothetical protein